MQHSSNSDIDGFTEEHLPPVLVVGAVAVTFDGELSPRISIVLDEQQSVGMEDFADLTHHKGVYLCEHEARALAETILFATQEVVSRVASMSN